MILGQAQFDIKEIKNISLNTYTCCQYTATYVIGNIPANAGTYPVISWCRVTMPYNRLIILQIITSIISTKYTHTYDYVQLKLIVCNIIRNHLYLHNPFGRIKIYAFCSLLF